MIIGAKKYGFLLLCCGVAQTGFAALSGASAQTVPSVPYGIGNAVQSTEQARHAAPQAPQGTIVLPQLAEPQFTLKDKKRS